VFFIKTLYITTIFIIPIILFILKHQYIASLVWLMGLVIILLIENTKRGKAIKRLLF